MSGSSRPSRARKSTSHLQNPVSWSQLSGMDVDGDEDGNAEFGALAFGNDYEEAEEDSDISKAEWDDQDDNSDDDDHTYRRGSSSKNQNPKSSRRQRPPSTKITALGHDSDDSQNEDSQDEDDEDQDTNTMMDMLDPALAGEFTGDFRTTTAGQAEADEIEFEPESFDRLVTSLQDTSRQAGALRQTWDTSIEAENAEFENELRAAAGFKKRKKVRRTPREQNLSPEVQSLLADANLAFVEQRLHDAIPKLEEVIRIEPAVMSAWRTLGLIYEELGEEEKSIQCRIIGAHLQPGATEEWKRLAFRSLSKQLYRQAIYCFQQAIKIDKTDIDCIWDRALLLRDLGDYKAAINGMLDILKLQPFDASVVRELIPMLVSVKDYERGIGILENWRLHCIGSFPDPLSGSNQDPEAQAGTENPSNSRNTAATHNTFQISELVTLADLMLLTRKPHQALVVLRQTARWLDGRGSESFWDDVADDREFDGDIDPRIRKERDNEGYGRQIETASLHTLDPEIRVRLGKARMMLGDIAEAKNHFDILTEGDPGDAPQIFAEVGDCYYEFKLWAEALDVLTDLADTEFGQEDVSLYAKLAACNHALGELEEAARLYEPVVEAVPDNLEWLMGLAEVYEGLGEKEKSLDILRQVMKALQAQRAAEAEAEAQHHDQPSEAISGIDATYPGMGESVDAQLSFFDEVAASSGLDASKGKSSTAKRARMNYDRQQRLKLEAQREQETILAWRRLELLDSSVFIPCFWRSDVMVSRESEQLVGGVYALEVGEQFESEAEKDVRYRQTAQWVEEAGALIDTYRSNRRLNNALTAKKRKAGASAGTRSSRIPKTPRPRFTSGIVAQPGAGGISTQAKNLLHRLQDQIMEEDLAEELTADDEEEGFDANNDGGGLLTKSLDLNKFRGLTIEQWITIFSKYCLILAKSQEPSSSSSINEIMYSLFTSTVIWGDFGRMLKVQLSWLSCSLYSRDYEVIYSCLRWLSQEMQFHNLPLLLTTSITNGLGFHSLGRWIVNKDTKFYQRRLRYVEAISNGLPCTFSEQRKRWIVPAHLFNALPDNSALTNADRNHENDPDGDDAGEDEDRQTNPSVRKRKHQSSATQSDGDEQQKKKPRSEAEDLVDGGSSRTLAVQGVEMDESAVLAAAGVDAREAIRSTTVHPAPTPVDASTIADAEVLIRLAKPTVPSPIGEIFYGYILLLGGGFQSSASFFSRVYCLQPNDPLVSLLATISFVSRSTNRQTDNRHHVVLQALTFFQRYKKLRLLAPPTKSALPCEEGQDTHGHNAMGENDTRGGIGDMHSSSSSSVSSLLSETQLYMETEYNAGRMMHHLSLFQLAEKHYLNVFNCPCPPSSSPPTQPAKKKTKTTSLKREAAWNLALIYTTSGTPHLAKTLMGKWLTV